jgi:hypothetical protein
LPHCAVTKFKNKYNPHHYKNMYAVLASQWVATRDAIEE